MLLIKGVLDGAGYPIAPLQLSVWAIPTALAALAIHGLRLMLWTAGCGGRWRPVKPPRTRPHDRAGLRLWPGGLMFAAVAVLSARDGANPKRWGNAAFWGLVATSFLAGDRIGGLANGLIVIALALLPGWAPWARAGRPAPRPSSGCRAPSASAIGC